ncbi:TetR/AcrR family transcriptional regulator [Paenibacillus donghaensis]|uniref:HTH tetR-type domain-containing protein n=1 Tax=Paenibacillus donghaensis TaxID=414771 RepID=A0A2Z2KCV2_9BACL|nr:TetR/AcrR family transcriptional regulator [Paenibacillus donghaensis]ASA24556.1 hypothetical protein B9T62_29660 [Paenibacillus donghaensis]
MADKSADKEELIIKTAMQLFALKGSSSTSMQEIASACGMSKGSLYLVFKSKEELERSLYIYCFRMIRDPLLREEQEERRTPQEKLRNQVEILLTHVYELREFLQRQVQEIAGRGIADVPEWLRKSNVDVLIWFQNKLEQVYGPEVLPYTGDLCLVAHGMISSYIRVIFQQDTPVSIARMADYVVDLMDIIVAGLLGGQLTPLISPAIVAGWMEEREGNTRRNPLQMIKEMKNTLGQADTMDAQEKNNLQESLTILESELLVPHPRRAIIQGMLSNLQAAPQLAGEVEELSALALPYLNHSCSFH